LETQKLQDNWLRLAGKYCENKNLLLFYLENIIKNYSERKRYYHNLVHINAMLKQASENKNNIQNYDEMLFAIWFHDIIYKATSKNNEEKSADFAKSTLKKISNGKINIDNVYQLIMSTKTHEIVLTKNNDNAFLLDFDLSILGQSWEVYQTYIQNIRKEYKIYPDLLYKPARKKVLEHFLNRENLFFTEKYQDLFEDNARKNLEHEIQLLS